MVIGSISDHGRIEKLIWDPGYPSLNWAPGKVLKSEAGQYIAIKCLLVNKYMGPSSTYPICLMAWKGCFPVFSPFSYISVQLIIKVVNCVRNTDILTSKYFLCDNRLDFMCSVGAII